MKLKTLLATITAAANTLENGSNERGVFLATLSVALLPTQVKPDFAYLSGWAEEYAIDCSDHIDAKEQGVELEDYKVRNGFEDRWAKAFHRFVEGEIIIGDMGWDSISQQLSRVVKMCGDNVEAYKNNHALPHAKDELLREFQDLAFEVDTYHGK